MGRKRCSWDGEEEEVKEEGGWGSRGEKREVVGLRALQREREGKLWGYWGFQRDGRRRKV